MSMWSEHDDEWRRGNVVKAAGDANPFIDVINKFYSKEMNDTTLDELALALEELPALQEFKDSLDAQQPAYTSIYRYDPSSIKFLGQDGCFSSRMSMGASVGYGRVFKGLTSDKIFSLRTPDEVMVVVQHPSRFIDTYEGSRDTEDPTVLFTSKMFQHDVWRHGRDETEEHQIGMIVKHADRPLDLIPDFGVTACSTSDGYIKYAVEQIKLEQLETA